ncbi:hypothetical protein CR159_20940 [Pollutimonas subterranea]|uniref:HNH nuclease domain-containing protein n=1 Tax=Pollutimonas subterranea TaxID=2045210 RepID=A0A2N4TYS6_9BURK|nr:HNH endonuclease [Pollutimonas subterranea]PLC47922.1 hypothetical protein CR159_20940 [Pollutimonas subterranea]
MGIEFKDELKRYLMDTAGLSPNSASQYLSYLNHVDRRSGVRVTIENALASKDDELWQSLNSIIDLVDGGKKTITNWRSAWRKYETFARWKLSEYDLASEIIEQEKSPQTEQEARTRILVSILRRQGQAKFRNTLLEAYRSQCAVTGCMDLAVLEAAHVRPYSADGQDAVSNGLILRSDIHTLFDKGLITIEHGTWRILCAETLSDAYRQYHDKTATMPSKSSLCPAIDALRERYREFHLK